MSLNDTEVAIVGGGAAGIGAARRLHDAGVRCVLIEARSRLGGRAWTSREHDGYALDLGCGWLHSAERNPWTKIAESQGRTIDRTPPPWMRLSLGNGFPPDEQRAFVAAQQAFYKRLDAAGEREPDRPASALLEPGDRWNNLMGAVATYVTGAELDQVSIIDFARYEDDGVNWRVVEGLGTTVAAHADGVPTVLDCAVQCIDHAGTRLAIETARGTIAADRVIVTVPSAVLAEEALRFRPTLPNKIEAAAGLPLGLADKLFLSLTQPEEFPPDSRLFGRTDRTATATYHLRPFGRPLIECYFGGRNAADLELGGQAAFFAFARTELTGLLGSAFARRIAPVALHGWRSDPFARGSYSFALPGKADGRAVLAAPVDERLFFAGEACSRHDFSTAHGALLTGLAAADAVIAARSKQQSRRAGRTA
ncbi:MAG: FAD-dependent oxidoreductase [Xanthobacteraceae bacterium]|nr:FAD-dependent oxidoreductase [Xanthobacteraceae bacterium]